MSKSTVLAPVAALAVAVGAVQAAGESAAAADTFAQKLAVIAQHGLATQSLGAPGSGGVRRTPISEIELNSWFQYRADPLLPPGLADPKVTILGDGRLSGVAIVDLEAIGRQRASGGGLDVWSYLGGRVPVSVTGILHTEDGRGRFEVERAEVSGVPLPRTLLQEVVSYYTRTPDHPQGLRLDDPFELPASIRRIEIGKGQAVVVQ